MSIEERFNSAPEDKLRLFGEYYDTNNTSLQNELQIRESCLIREFYHDSPYSDFFSVPKDIFLRNHTNVSDKVYNNTVIYMLSCPSFELVKGDIMYLLDNYASSTKPEEWLWFNRPDDAYNNGMFPTIELGVYKEKNRDDYDFNTVDGFVDTDYPYSVEILSNTMFGDDFIADVTFLSKGNKFFYNDNDLNELKSFYDQYFSLDDMLDTYSLCTGSTYLQDTYLDENKQLKLDLLIPNSINSNVPSHNAHLNK